MKTLTYHGGKQENKTLSYRWSYDGQEFKIQAISDVFEVEIPNVLLQHYGIFLSAYYFNVDNFEKVHVESLNLSDKQHSFFEKLFVKGLAEHRYTNGFAVDQHISFSSNQNIPSEGKVPYQPSKRFLSMIGGGKDSLVGIELLKALDPDIGYLGMNTNPQSLAALDLLGETSSLIHIVTERDPNPHDKKFPYHGHHPGTAMRLFAAILAAYAEGYRHVVVANEYSASFDQITVDGIGVNHQYSKSLEYERDLNEYLSEFIIDELGTFSILRPLYELQIAKIFAGFDKYHPIFISCNVAFREKQWCKNCSKCAFVYAIIAPFIDADQITEIWGENLLQRETICKHLADIVTDAISPLECIGTKEETKVALKLCEQKGLLDDSPEEIKNIIMGSIQDVTQDDIDQTLSFYSSDTEIPEEIAEELKMKVQEYIK